MDTANIIFEGELENVLATLRQILHSREFRIQECIFKSVLTLGIDIWQIYFLSPKFWSLQESLERGRCLITPLTPGHT
jgi:hypothetical protein